MKILITEEQYQYILENTQEIDDILDKINDFGYETLSDLEKTTLNHYSEWLKSGKKDDFSPKNDDFFDENDENTGEEFDTVLKDGSRFSYRFDYKEDIIENKSDKWTHFYGTVIWNDQEWVGVIVYNDKMNKITEIDFFLESYEGHGDTLIHSMGEEVRLQDELGRLLPQVIYFLSEDVIPNL